MGRDRREQEGLVGRLRRRSNSEKTAVVKVVAVGNVGISEPHTDCFLEFVPLKVEKLGIYLLAFGPPSVGGGA